VARVVLGHQPGELGEGDGPMLTKGPGAGQRAVVEGREEAEVRRPGLGERHHGCGEILARIGSARGDGATVEVVQHRMVSRSIRRSRSV
jgi:hypothetical protein